MFAPSESGITAIVGDNGTGKSSLVNGIAWLLFGTKIGGSKNKDIMRSGVSYQKGRFYARAVVEVDGQDLLVERRFVSKSGTVEADVYVLSEDSVDDAGSGLTVDDEGVSYYSGRALTHLAGPAVSHAEAYLRQRLHMDEKGFLSSILVQQKQVDQLISASAKDRAAVIEDLTGITAVSDALSSARAEYNEMKKAASHSHADEEAIKETEDQVYEASSLVRVHEDAVSRLKGDLKELKEKGREQSQKVNEAQKNHDKRADLESRLDTLKQRIVDKQTQADTLLEDRRERKEALGDMTSADSAKKVIAERDEAQQKHSRENENLASLKAQLEQFEKQMKANAEVIEKACGEEDPEECLRRAEDHYDSASRRLEELRSRVSSLESEVESKKQAISVITGGDACPTCLQQVDDVSAAVGPLQKSVQENEEKIAEFEKESVSLTEDVEKSTMQVSACRRAVECSEANAKHEEEAKRKREEIEYASGVIRDVKDTLKGLEKRAESATNIVYQMEEYQKVREKAQQVSRELNMLTMDAEEIREELKNVPQVSRENLQKHRDALDKRRAAYQKMDTERVRVEGEERVARERKVNLEERLKELRQDMERHRKVMDAVNIAAGSVKLLEQFRRELIDSSVPVIENYASDFLARFTDGKFVKVNMDNKFNTSVLLADGTERSVGALSGGELSSAAIALRLAIAMLLGGRGKSSVVLDEVLVSQDAARSTNIMNVIKDTAQGQVIFIAHHDAVNVIADEVFEIQVDESSVPAVSGSESESDDDTVE